MPIYAYRCATCGHAQDALQKMSDPVLTVCPACGAATYVKQVTAAGFQLKGSGWYVTDFREGSKAPKPTDGAAAGDKADNGEKVDKVDKGDKGDKGDKKAPSGGEGAAAAESGKKADTPAAPAPAPSSASPSPAPAAAPAAAPPSPKSATSGKSGS